MEKEEGLTKLEREEYLSSYAGDDRVVSSDDYKKEIAGWKDNEVHFYSKLPTFDRYADGFEGGELIVISGPTKNGKTTFAQTLTKNFQEQGIHSLWFTFEVQPRLFFKRFVTAEKFYLPRKLYDKRLDWLEDRIIESKIKYNTKAVFIDHLHYLVDIERMRNSSLDIGSVIRKLKLICVEYNIVIFLMAHTTKIKFDEMPSEENVRDSSFIPQEADSTLMIWRQRDKNRKTKKYEETGRTMLVITNHRRTGVMAKTVELKFNSGVLYESAVQRQLDVPDELSEENIGL